MKRHFGTLAAAAAMVLGFAAPALASDWLRNGTTLTEQNAPGTPWVLKITVANTTEISVTAVTTAGTNTELDFSGAIKDASGTDYTIVSLDGFTGKPITKLVFPAGIRTTKRDAFLNCTALKTVEPLIPDTITEFGQRTFAGCTALEGDVVFPANTITSPYNWQNGTWGWFNGSQITSCDMSAATMEEIVKYSFANCPKLKWVKLPQGLTTISEFAFYNSVALEQIEPFLPDTVTTIRQQVFASCKALSIPFTLSGTDAVTLTSDSNGGKIFNGSAVTSADITAPLETLGALFNSALYGRVFYGAASMGEIRLPTALKTVRNLNFSGCKVLTNLVFRSAYPTEFDLTSFSGLTDYKTRLYIPRFDSSWEAVTAGTGFAPMDDTLTAKFRQYYPDDAILPLGLWTIVTKNEQNQGVTIHVWVNDIYPWAESNAVHVDGSPFLADGTDEKVSPGYGLYTNVADGESRTFTAPATGEFDGGTYRCGGYRLSYEETHGSRVMSDPVVSTDLSCTIDQTDGRVWHLTWLWAANGFALDATPFVPALGSSTCDPEPVGGVYAPDTEVTVTAIPADGCRFVCWTGDVPEGQEKNTSVTLTMDAAKVCRPVFAGPWTFNGSNQITDGNWTLTVKNASGELGVTGVASVTDETALDLTMPISDGNGGEYAIVSVGGFSNRGLRFVLLPEGLRAVDASAFAGCASLEQVEPLLPSTVTAIGQKAFSGCSRLAQPLTLAGAEPLTFLADAYGSYAFQNTGIPSVDISSPLVELGATYNETHGKGYVFDGMASCGSIRLPPEVRTVCAYIFGNCTSLTNLIFTGSCPASFDVRAFVGMPSNKVRLFIPRFDASWEAITKAPEFAPMDDALEAAYRAVYPDDAVLPLGRWTVSGLDSQLHAFTCQIWVSDIYPWAESNAIYVDAAPFLADGTDEKVTPGYGLYTDVANGESRTFTAPELGEFGGGTYRCAGYVLTYETGFATREFSDPVVSTDLSCTIEQAHDRVWRLTWQWAANGFTLDTTPFVPAQGSSTCDPEPVGGVYEPGTVVTVTATAADGCRFVRWTGDVPEGQEKNTSVTLTMDAAKVCRPVFAGPWTFNGSNQITDGNWTLTVKNASGELSVSGFVSAGDMTMLDLTMPISDADGNAYTVVSVGGFTGKGVRSLALPSTLRRIENQAFYNCTALESVTPLLPASLVYLGQGCFNGCTSLGGDVTFPANTIESPYSWISADNAYGWFRASRITSCDMSAATVTTIRAYSFSGCQQLERVKLSQGLTAIETAAFSDATALTTVSPLFPASVAEVGAKAFYNCKLLEGDIVFPKTDGIVTFLEGGNVGASNFQNCEKITSFSLLADFYYKYNSNEPVRGRLGQNFLAGCKALKSVTISEVASDLSKNSIFAQSPALSEIVFLGETAPLIPPSGLFPNVPDYQAIVKIPSLTDSWAEFGAKWFTDPTADEKAAYAALPGAVGRPKKIWKDAAKRRLFVRYLRTEGFSVIVR